MTIEFYYMPESPPCRAVELVADKLNIKLIKKHLDMRKGDHLNENYLKINPLHCVPTIVDGDLTIWESRAIITYLVNKYATMDNSLYPSEPAKRAKVDMMLYYDMGTLFRAQTELLKPLLDGKRKLDSDKDAKFREALRFLDEVLSKQQFAAGDELSVADISIVVGLTFSEACDYDLRDFRNVESYRDRVKSNLPTYDLVNEEPIRRFRDYIKSKNDITSSSLRDFNEIKDNMKDIKEQMKERVTFDSYSQRH